MKNHKLSKLKKDNVELKAKLEELNSDSKAGLESSIQNDNDSNPIDELCKSYTHLILSHYH